MPVICSSRSFTERICVSVPSTVMGVNSPLDSLLILTLAPDFAWISLIVSPPYNSSSSTFSIYHWAFTYLI